MATYFSFQNTSINSFEFMAEPSPVDSPGFSKFGTFVIKKASPLENLCHAGEKKIKQIIENQLLACFMWFGAKFIEKRAAKMGEILVAHPHRYLSDRQRGGFQE